MPPSIGNDSFYLDFGGDGSEGDEDDPMEGPSNLSTSAPLQKTNTEDGQGVTTSSGLLLPAHVFVSEITNKDVALEEGEMEMPSSPSESAYSNINFVDEDSRLVSTPPFVM